MAGGIPIRNETQMSMKILKKYTTNCRRIRVLPHDDMQYFCKKKKYRKQRQLKDKIRWVNKAKRIIKGYDKIITTNPSAALMNPQGRMCIQGARRNLGQASAAIGAW